MIDWRNYLMEPDIKEYKKAIAKAVNKINEMSEKLQKYETDSEIAIIGYDCKFPGGASSPEKYWNLLLNKKSALVDISERFLIDDYYSEDKEIGKLYTKKAFLLTSDVYGFDNVHFEISEQEATSIDPQQRILLETSWNALLNAGLDIESLKKKKVGVFIGLESFDYANTEFISKNVSDITPYTLFGVMPTSAAGRLAYYYDFRGPAITCDTACSSSLSALNIAVESLKSYQCDIAIVGGVNLILSVEPFIGLSQIGALSKDGTCKTFDMNADGFGRGEGCGVVILQRSYDAEKQGNHICSVIKSIAVGQDGKSNGFYAPNGIAEQEIMEKALSTGNISPDDVDYIETHGTGTVLGDTMEVQAIANAYGGKKSKIKIGSVKTNIGHLEAAAGMAGLIKVLLSMKHGMIPASLNCVTPNPNIDLSNVEVVTNTVDWKANNGKRCAAISCFGITGSLAHVIIMQKEQEKETAYDLPYKLITLSSKRKSALPIAVDHFIKSLENVENDLNDIAYTSNIANGQFKHCLYTVGKDKEEIISNLKEYLENDKMMQIHSGVKKNNSKNKALLFTGQGSIYQKAGFELYKNSSPYKEAFDECSNEFNKVMGIDLVSILYSDEKVDFLKPEYSQPAIFALEYSMSKFWEKIGIVPDVVIGHSIGEYAAACYAGLFTLQDAVKMIAARSELMEKLEPNGKMVGVLAAADDVNKAIIESNCKNVSIAAINGPINVTISGYNEEVDRVVQTLHKSKRVFVTDLGIAYPYHSVVISKYANELKDGLEGIKCGKLKIKMISSVTGDFIDETEIGKMDYWANHLCRTVDFCKAINTATKSNISSFIEVGAMATLTGIASQCIPMDNNIFAPSLRKGVDCYKQLLDSIGLLYVNGFNIDFRKVYESRSNEIVEIGEYPFIRKQFAKENLNNGNSKDLTLSNKNKENVEMSDNQTTLKDNVLKDIIDTVHALTGIDRDDIDKDEELISYGFDSLLLASLGKQIENKFGFQMSMDKLFTSLNTLDKISAKIVENCDLKNIYEDNSRIEEVVISDAKIENNQVIPTNNIISNNSYAVSNTFIPSENSVKPIREGINSSSLDWVNNLFELQINLMREQNQILTEFASRGEQFPVYEKSDINRIKSDEINAANKIQPAVTSKEMIASEKKQSKNNDYYLPYHKMTLKENSKVEALQLKYLKNIESKYNLMTKNSKNQTQRYRDVYASNRNSAGFRPLYKEMLYQIIAQSGHGSKLVDIDGNEFIDLTMGFGVNFFGHCPQFVEEALKEEIKRGFPLGPMSCLAGTVAQQISELTGVERVFFCNSGTEADMFAVRIARAITGKNKIVCFKGAFHGTYDGFLGVPSMLKNIDTSTFPMAPGITENAVKDLLLLDFDSDESIEYIKKNSDMIAGVITEPVQSRRPDIQPREFLHKLREVTQENNIALIFDEIITGFRIGAGGAQEYFGVEADIATYGKVIGGGLPIGVVSGKGKFLDSIDGGMWRFGDDSVPPCDEKRTFVAGTFCHHPLAMASCHATLSYIMENKDKIYPAINEKTAKFVESMNKFFTSEKIPFKIYCFGSLFRFNVTKDKEIFYYGMLEKGIYIWEGRNCFFSTEHTNQDIAKVEGAVKQTVLEMKEAGYFSEASIGSKNNKKKNDLDELKMSLIQQRLVSHMMITETDPFDIVSAYKVNSDVDLFRIEKVVNEIISRHSILRTALFIENGEYRQRVLSEWNFKIKTVNSINDEISLNDFISSSMDKFDLSKPPLIEVILIDSNKYGKILVFHFHHTVSDGISMNIFVNEFSRLYSGENLETLKSSYFDYVDWENEYINSEKFKEDKEFWNAHLSSASEELVIPYDYPVKVDMSYSSNTVYRSMDEKKLSTLKTIAKENHCTLFMLLMGLVGVTIYKCNNEKNITLFTPTSSRFSGGFENNIGMFTNSMVICNPLDEKHSFKDYMRTVKNNLIEAYAHSDYPFNILIRDINKNGVSNFKTYFVYENVDGRDIGLTDLSLSEIIYVPTVQEEDLIFELLENRGKLNIYLRYRSDLYSKESIERLIQRFFLIIDQVIADGSLKISDYSVTTEEEKKLILTEFNATKIAYPKDKTVTELFEEQVNKTPGNTALVFEDKKLTYEELNTAANSLAHKLRELGVKPDDFVAIIADRSIEIIAGIYGIIKAGGAYVPIDPTYPEERINFILKDCVPKAILKYTTESITVPSDIPVLDLSANKVWEGIYPNPEHVNSSSDLIYCIYTSGTTGQPKGSLVEHKSVVRLVKDTNYIDLDEHTVILQTGSMSFDASTLEVWGAFLNGGKLVITVQEVITDNIKLRELMKNQQINTMWLTSTLFNQMISEDNDIFDGLEHLLIGGEKLSDDHVRMMKSRNNGVKLTNGYGPTENTTFTTTYEIPVGFENIPIGKPISNTQVYILNGMDLCGIGVPGELCITGDGVARGYLNRPELTSEKFVNNPFGEGKMYRSGDLARWLSDGNIEYLGRIDEQVKIRGFRVELGEIESYIREIENIKDCAVIAKADASGDKAIYAYYTSDVEVGVSDVRKRISVSLPKYMIPSYMMQIEAIPVTRNGKLDKRALPEIEAAAMIEYVAPRNKIEEIICNIFKEILNLEKIGVKDSFFDLGGHSLRATRLVNKIESETGIRMALKDIFAHPTPEQLAEILIRKKGEKYSTIPMAEEKEFYPMTSAQKRVYLIQHMQPQSLTYNMPAYIKFTGDVNVDSLRNAFQEMLNRHEILRTQFFMVKGEPVQKILNHLEGELEYIESSLPDEKLISEYMKPFDLSAPPLVRAKLVNKGKYHLLMMDMHHIIGDGMSLNTFTREIMALYKGEKLEALTHQFKDYSEWLKNRDLSSQAEYWTEQFGDEIPVLDFPTDFVRPQEQSYAGSEVKYVLDEKLNVAINETIKKTGSTEYMLFLAAVMITLSKYSRQNDIVIGSPISARTHKDTEGMLGMFVNTLAMRGRPEQQKNFNTFLMEIKETCLKAYENQEYPFESLIESVDVQRDRSRNPLFDVMLAFQNNEQAKMIIGDRELGYTAFKSTIAKFDMTFNIEKINNKYEIILEYCTDLFRKETVEALLIHLEKVLVEVTANGGQKLGDIDMLTKREKDVIFNNFNNTYTKYENNKTVVTLFEEQVERTPDNIAVVFENKSITYAELNAKANSLAHKLREHGIKPDDFVAVIADKSIEIIEGIYGIIKAGGAYVPIDPTYPKERISFMLEDCSPKVVLKYTTESISINNDITVIDLRNREVWEGLSENPEHVNKPNDLIYCIYTSGTTGKPKGVIVEHHNVVKLVRNCDYTNLNEKSVILQTGQLMFDASTFEVWGSSLNGGVLHLVNKETMLNAKSFKKYITENSINTLFITTALFNQFINEDKTIFNCLDHLMFGGEATSERHVEMLRSQNTKIDFRNVYGPTETTTFATHYIIDKRVDKTPIGKPISNTQIYICNGKKLCGIGVPGELCIAGDGVARGYLNRTELTAEKFIKNPFGDGRIYRSGDLARWLPDGNIEYLGRIDEQVKIRGFRIELGEIESRIRENDSINDCVVITKEDANGEKALYAYYTSSKNIDINELKGKLRGILPEYMVPAYMMQLEAFPLTKNGKLDKRALPDIKIKSTIKYVKPRNEQETVLCSALTEILGIDKVGIMDNYFDLGGDSLKAIKIVGFVRNHGWIVTVQNIIQYQRVDLISEKFHRLDQIFESEYNNIKKDESFPLSEIQKTFQLSNLNDPDYFNFSALFDVVSSISEELLKNALKYVFNYHDMLKCYFENDSQKITDEMNYSFESFDIRNEKSYEEVVEEIKNCMRMVQQKIHLNDCLIALGLIKTNAKSYIYIVVHHIVCDAVSIQIIAEDIFNAYYCMENNSEIRLPNKTLSFAKWNEKLNGLFNSKEFKNDAVYWENMIKQIEAVNTQITIPDKHNFVSKKFSYEISNLNSFVKINKNLNENDIFVLAFGYVLCEIFDLPYIPVASESHGRYDDLFVNSPIFRTVGWFTNIYASLVESGGSFGNAVKRYEESKKKMLNHGVGFLKAENDHNPKNSSYPFIAINYFGEMESKYTSINGIHLNNEITVKDIASNNYFLFLLSFSIVKRDDTYVFNLIYDDNFYDSSKAEELIAKGVELINKYLKQFESDLIADTDLSMDNVLTESSKLQKAYEENILDNSYEEYELTGIQKISFQMGSKNAVAQYPLYDYLDLKKFQNVWNRIVEENDVLRSSITFKNGEGNIRIYDYCSVEIPYIDLSDQNTLLQERIIQTLLDEMDVYYLDEMYSHQSLASRVLFIKLSDTSYKMLFSCSHMIFDRFSADVMKSEIIKKYYGETSVTSDRREYKNYYRIYRNCMATAPETELVEKLELHKYLSAVESLNGDYNNVDFKSFIYQYENMDEWEKLGDEKSNIIAKSVFIESLRFSFPDKEIPVLSLHLARNLSDANLFDYLGEMLDVIPFTISADGNYDIDEIVKNKYEYLRQNNTFFSALMFKNDNDKYNVISEMLNKMYKERKKFIFVFNDTGILKDANSIIYNSEKYRIAYNVMSLVVFRNGLYMNTVVEADKYDSLKTHLDTYVKKLLEIEREENN